MNWFNNLWKGISGAVKGAGQTAGQFLGGPVNMASQAGANVGRGISQFAPNIIKSLGPKPAMAAEGSGRNIMANIPKPPSMPSVIGALGPRARSYGSASDITANPATSTKGGGIGKGILDLFGTDMGKVGAGIGANLLGEAFAPKVNMPDINSLSSVQNLRDYSGSSLPKGVEDSINRSVDLQHQEELKRLQDTYKNVRPGTDYSTDSTYQRDLANLERRQTLNRADAQSNAMLQFNQQELGRLQELAQTDIYNIMIKLGMDAQEASQFKQTFSNVGSMFMQSGLGLNNFKVS